MNEERNQNGAKDVDALDTLILRYFEGSLSSEEFENFNALVERDPKTRERMINISHQVFMVREMLASRLTEDTQAVDVREPDRASLLAEVFDQERRARIRRDAEAALEKQQQETREAERRESMRMLAGLSKPDNKPQTRHYVIPRPLFYGSIAAVIVIAVAIIWTMIDRPDESPRPSKSVVSQAVATMESSHNAVWTNAAQLSSGDELSKGRYQLLEGLTRIRYSSGAEVIVQSPADFTLDSDKQITLQRGKIVGYCPTESSKGFVVQASNLSVRDLGTEFGVSVQDNGAIVQVYDGSVELTGRSQGIDVTDQEVLAAGAARTVSPDGSNISVSTLDHAAFVREREYIANLRSTESPYHRWVAWQYELLRDEDVVLHLDFDNGVKSVVKNRSAMSTVGDASASGVANILGRFEIEQSLAAHFMSDDDRLEIDVAETYSALTLSGWFYFSEEPKIMSLLTSYDWLDGQGRIHWQAIPGLLTFDQSTPDTFGNAYGVHKAKFNVSGKSLRKWIHLAVTFDSNTGASATFINGQRVGVDSIPRDVPINIGRAGIGYWTDDGQGRPIRTFHGRIDEFTIWKRSLTKEEIELMFNAGKPDP